MKVIEVSKQSIELIPESLLEDELFADIGREGMDNAKICVEYGSESYVKEERGTKYRHSIHIRLNRAPERNYTK